MRINIYTSLNGVGLERDANILKSIFESVNHAVEIYDYPHRKGYVNKSINHADIALHLEIPRYEIMGLSNQNIFIPNPEWCEVRWMQQVKKFNHVFAKTRDTEQIIQQYHQSVIFTSFTSLDKYNPKIKKDKVFVHTAGKSSFKGTNEILQAYGTNDLPQCYMTTQQAQGAKGNIIAAGYLNERDFDVLLNACLIHLCPSYYEGFGHCIGEAMSTGAVVITTDSAPMNEFITDKRFLVESNNQSRHHLGVLHYPSYQNLAAIIRTVNEMDFDTLNEIGQMNRQKFLQNDMEFKERIISLIC